MLRSLVSAARPVLASSARADIGATRMLTSTSTARGKSGSGPSTSSASASSSSASPSSTSSASTSSTTSSSATPPSSSSTPPTSATASSSSTTPPPPSTKPLVRESSTPADALNTLPLPYLSFAIGVPTPPSSAAPTWSERRETLTSTDYRMASRTAIVKEATRGYFHDFHAIRSHGGKTWRAPSTLIREDRSLYFPRFAGTRLADRASVNTVDMLRGKVSIVALLGSKISEEHTKSFYADTVAEFQGRKGFQLVQINLQNNKLKSYLVSLFLASLRSQIPQEWHQTYLLSSQNIELEKDALGYHNKHVGYTYLVDERGKVRWAGGAFAEEGERDALKRCTGVLLERVGEKRK
ncbi:ATPase assembly factor ATP10, mitochondria [Kalmanozyma brasiliensis GHG001]|uniref:ATPase assembly factor ATP10, mitochondria n=1 Tax=Kalmanozyma brasiliensis (strain GHG001) TaxID=1365824 RepID=UPI0028682479|nr:ATPase assembly factor ATP10, mitochondria [Kalmanozyma brasiliensis GHG001]KAF6767575.1 ATPase assembly factor ATP10, mitochondria [Kalmanozyma brasiliensis GHG001]